MSDNTATQPTPQSVAMFYTEGSSDKEYRAELRDMGNGLWMTLGFNGRRGGTLTEQKKTPIPVDYAVALDAYNKVVKEKTKKGYTTDTSGAIYQSLPSERAFSGFVPQLLNTVRDVLIVENYINDPSMYGQEKHDGERRPISLENATVTGINKEGLVAGLPLGLVEDVQSLGFNQIMLDGEVLGDRYVAFDLLQLDDKNLRTLPYEERLEMLEKILKDKAFNGIECVVTARTPAEKRKLLEGLRDHKAEGMVFKKKTAPYAPGRPASGGSQMKYKFTEMCSVLVSSHNKTKRSVFVEGLEDDLKTVVALGKITIPPNMAIPAVGTLVNIEYLYRFPKGALFQTIYHGDRPGNDQTLPDNVSKLKEKPQHAYRVDDDKSEDDLDSESEVVTSNPVQPKVSKSKNKKM